MFCQFIFSLFFLHSVAALASKSYDIDAAVAKIDLTKISVQADFPCIDNGLADALVSEYRIDSQSFGEFTSATLCDNSNLLKRLMNTLVFIRAGKFDPKIAEQPRGFLTGSYSDYIKRNVHQIVRDDYCNGEGVGACTVYGKPVLHITQWIAPRTLDSFT